MHLLIKPNNILITIDNGPSMFYTELKNLYIDHSQPHEGDAGLDIFNPEDIIVEPKSLGKSIDFKIQCEGFIDNTKEKNCWYYLVPRSSISKTPLRMSNSIGIIDAGYRGNIMAAVDNIKNEDYSIKAGQRLFQICGPNLEELKVIVVDNVSELSESERGEGGFGSTGV